jgi:ABC-type transporter Mla MlaB component
MGAGHFEICRSSADRVELELSGELSESTLLDCEAELRAQLCATKAGGIKVVVDLRRVKGYSLEARMLLVALQRFLGDKASQTAFIAASAAGRSLALWVAHMTEGQVLKSFGRREDAADWLCGSVGPKTGVRPVLRAREHRLASRSKKAAS